MLSELTKVKFAYSVNSKTSAKFTTVYRLEKFLAIADQRRNMFSLAIRKEPTTFALLKGTT